MAYRIIINRRYFQRSVGRYCLCWALIRSTGCNLWDKVDERCCMVTERVYELQHSFLLVVTGAQMFGLEWVPQGR